MKLTIEKVINKAYGLAHTDEGKAVMLLYTLSGEEVQAEVIEEKKNLIFAHPSLINKPSKFRIEPCCPHYMECGGCNMLHIDRDEELRIKANWIEEEFSSFPAIKIEPIFAGSRLGYRSRAKFSASNKRVGFLKAYTNEIVEIKDCPLLSPELNKTLSKINPSKSLPDGEVKKIMILEGNGEFELDGKKFQADSSVFFQANREVALAIKDYVLSHVKGNVVYDFYGGVGFFSAFLEDKGFDVTTVESNPLCESFAKRNLKRARFIPSQTEKALKFLKKKRGDTSIVDPPRTGMTRKAIETVASLTDKTIIYVSCDYKTLRRDLCIFEEFGFKRESVKAFDMFPATAHLETVAILTRQETGRALAGANVQCTMKNEE